MTTVSIDQARTDLTQLIERVAGGEDIVIAREGRPVARIVRAEEPAPAKRQGGLDRGKIRVADDFDAPLPPEIQKYFE